MNISKILNRKLNHQWLLPAIIAFSSIISAVLLVELAMFGHTTKQEIILALGVLTIVILLLWIFKQHRALKTACQWRCYNPTTAPPNEECVYAFLDKQLAQADPEQNEVALLFVDIDQFQSVNERYGYEYGDKLLKKVGNVLKHTVLPSSLVVRFAGDQFLAVIPQVNQEQTQQIAANLVSHCQKPFQIDGYTMKITVSVGVAMSPFHALNRTTLLQYANAALYQAKHKGRNTYQFFIQTLFAKRKHAVNIEQKMHFAIENDELHLNFHPIMKVATEELIGLEVLLRWHNQVLGTVPPNEFIQIAEASGMIADLDHWMVTKAIQCFKEWEQQTGDINLYFSLNFSTVVLQGDTILTHMRQMLQDTQINPAKLVIEVTETAFIEQPEKAIKTLNQLKDLGLKIAIDDFGTGYSSFDYLKRLPVTLTKIDKTFISDMAANQDNREIVQAIIQLASTMNMWTLAEGVETRQDLDFLAQFGCEYAQGFYFTKPMDESTTKQYLSKYFDRTIDLN